MFLRFRPLLSTISGLQQDHAPLGDCSCPQCWQYFEEVQRAGYEPRPIPVKRRFSLFQEADGNAAHVPSLCRPLADVYQPHPVPPHVNTLMDDTLEEQGYDVPPRRMSAAF